MIPLALRPTPADLAEADAIDALADQLTHLAEAATTWRDHAARPLARCLREKGDLGSDAARIEYVAYATLFQLAFGELKEALLNAQTALDRDGDLLPGLTLDEANALRLEITRRHPGAQVLIQVAPTGAFYLLAYLPILIQAAPTTTPGQPAAV